MKPITFTVDGVAQAQGSGRAYTYKRTDENGGGFGARIDHDNKKLKSWRRDVTRAATRAYRGPALDGPMKVDVVFYLPRPKTVKRTSHTVQPDCDKLARAVGDALTGVLYRDDAQIVEWHPKKQYADTGTGPRAVITVTPVTEEGTLFDGSATV